MSGAKFLVTATHAGFLDQYRKPGDKFEVTEEQFTDRWMVRGEGVSSKPVNSLAKQARQEALIAGGPSAALTTALADLKEANDREAAALARIKELEDTVAERDRTIVELQGLVQEDAPSADEAPPEEAAPPPEEAAPPPEEAPPAAPVQRVRRTAQD